MFARVLETEFAAVVDEHRVDVLDGRITLDVESADLRDRGRMKETSRSGPASKARRKRRGRP